MHASIAVLPAPMTVNPRAGSVNATKSLTGMNRAAGSTANDGVCVDGIGVSRYVASTTLRLTRTAVVSPGKSFVFNSSALLVKMWTRSTLSEIDRATFAPFDG